MDEKIRVHVDQIVVERYPERTDRSRELEIELLNSLRMMADRIDHGFNFDVRAPESEEASEDGETLDPADVSIAEATARIVAASPKLKYINRTG